MAEHAANSKPCASNSKSANCYRQQRSNRLSLRGQIRQEPRVRLLRFLDTRMNNRPRATVQRTKAQEFGAAFVAARRGYLGLLMFLASTLVTAVKALPQAARPNSANRQFRRRAPPPRRWQTLARLPRRLLRWATQVKSMAGGRLPRVVLRHQTGNSPSIFGGSAPPPTGGTAWNPNQPAYPYGSQGSIFDQAPPTQQKGVFDSFAGGMNPYPSGSFNPGGATHGYESPSSTFTAAIPAHSTKRGSPGEASSGSWWDRLTEPRARYPRQAAPGGINPRRWAHRRTVLLGMIRVIHRFNVNRFRIRTMSQAVGILPLRQTRASPTRSTQHRTTQITAVPRLLQRRTASVAHSPRQPTRCNRATRSPPVGRTAAAPSQRRFLRHRLARRG